MTCTQLNSVNRNCRKMTRISIETVLTNRRLFVVCIPFNTNLGTEGDYVGCMGYILICRLTCVIDSTPQTNLETKISILFKELASNTVLPPREVKYDR